MNIVGEGFPDEINGQIEQRQKIYGSGLTNNRSIEEIQYLNSNTAWCRLMSSVNIKDKYKNDTIKNIGLLENRLAKEYVLFGGVSSYPATNVTTQRAGIEFREKDYGDKAYGIGGTEFGYRPMMGIQSAHVKSENRGSIRTATVKIKAWNKEQFDIIDTLYLRLGFSVLLEWGHSMYYDDKGVFHNGEDRNSLYINFLKQSGTERYILLDLIQEERLKTFGNYDAMFGKVRNFHWSFLKDGSYDITLDLVSMGDIVESFKINLLTDSYTLQVGSGSKKELEEMNSDEVITEFAKRNDIGKYFYELVQPKI